MLNRRTRSRTPLAVLLAGAALHLAAGPSGAPAPAAPPAQHVILFIGDGMSLESEIAGSRYLAGRDRALAWHAFPGQWYAATWDVTSYDINAKAAGRPAYSEAVFTPALGYDVLREGARPFPDEGSTGADRPVVAPATDSASAATALATGVKTTNGNIAWRPGDAPDGRLATIADDFRAAAGGAIGVVTTVPFSHATPAGFVSHNTSRNHYYTGHRGYDGLGIADEIILRTKPDVVIGAGHPVFDNPGFDPKKGYVSERLYRALQASSDYVLAEEKAGADGGRTLAAAAGDAVARGKKLFGLFGGPGGNFGPALPEESPGAPRFTRGSASDPTLEDATTAALEVLGRCPRGFFLMVEQGDIDWANHDNDFRRVVGCVADLDAAVRAAVAFVDRPGDDIDWTNTLLIVTADHATGGLRLDPRRPLAAGELPRQIARPASAAAEDDRPETSANGRQHAPIGPWVPPAKSPFFYPDGEVSYSTIGHTNELVTLAAKGAAAHLFLKYEGLWYPGPIIDNTQVNAVMREGLGLAPRPR
ncbi:MAG TPA: alkaline phosphatase [Terriglobales bacterium]|nr:alkaline phosphatase [Terriglobales bacterium]